MTLLARPARKIAGAKVARKSLLTGDLGGRVGAVAQPAVGAERIRHRVHRRIKLQRRGTRSNQVEAKGNSRSNPAVEQFSACDRGWHAALPRKPVEQRQYNIRSPGQDQVPSAGGE